MSSEDRQNRSALFSGGAEPGIVAYASESSTASRSGISNEDQYVASGDVDTPGGSRESGTSVTRQGVGLSIMQGMLGPAHSQGGHNAGRGGKRGLHPHVTQGPSSGMQSSGLPEGDGRDSNLERQLKEILAISKRNADAIDGIFAEVRALSGNVMQMRQELVILKQSSARFPSASVNSSVNRVSAYDP